jgi:hypothetical protein
MRRTPIVCRITGLQESQEFPMNLGKMDFTPSCSFCVRDVHKWVREVPDWP